MAGRPKMTELEKAEAAVERAQIKAEVAAELEDEAGEDAAVEIKSRPKPKAKKDQLYEVKLLKNYRPAEGFMVNDGGIWRQPLGSPEKVEDGKIVVVASAEHAKVPAGTLVRLSKNDAERVINNNLGERADNFFDD